MMNEWFVFVRLQHQVSWTEFSFSSREIIYTENVFHLKEFLSFVQTYII